MSLLDPWTFLVIGYIATVSLEGPVLWWGLSARHPRSARVSAGLWLTACTYPVVVLVLPPLFTQTSRWPYLLTAETFAPLAECLLFTLAYHRGAPRRDRMRDWVAITVANVVSFLAGEAYYWVTTRG